MYSSILSLFSAVDEVGGQSHAPAALLGERLLTHCIAGWVHPSVDGRGRFRPYRDSIPGPSSP
jgi:hypothetical protein